MKKTVSLLILTLLFSFAHPFYLSVTELKYNSAEQSLQGSVKIFTNDLEAALKKRLNCPVDLINPKDTAETKKILERYLLEHLEIKIDQNAVHYEIIGFEQEQEASWIYIEAKNLNPPKNILIFNSILYDHLRSQSNIVHFDLNGNRQSSKVNYPEKEIQLKF
jgi:hypothetical protein